MNTLIASTSKAGCRASFAARISIGLLLACASTLACAQTPDPKAILSAMSQYVAAQETIEVAFDSDIEVITSDMEKLQFTSSGELKLHRPDKLYAHRVGGYADVELFFDGKTADIYGKHLNAYAQVEIPGTVDQLVAALRDGHGIAVPGADLLLSNSYEVLVADVLEAKYMGRGVIGGVECEHLAFRNFDTDWQLWVEVGAKPIPRKLVITSKTVNGAPQYTLRVTRWKSGHPLASGDFTFKVPAGATVLAPDALIDLDELPQGAPSGGGK